LRSEWDHVHVKLTNRGFRKYPITALRLTRSSFCTTAIAPTTSVIGVSRENRTTMNFWSLACGMDHAVQRDACGGADFQMRAGQLALAHGSHQGGNFGLGAFGLGAHHHFQQVPLGGLDAISRPS
jgi:hypothetical protein